MDPLAFLERECLKKNIYVNTANDQEIDRCKASVTVTEDTADTLSTEPEIVACYTYPQRHTQSPVKDAERTRKLKRNNRSSRSRSRSRDRNLHSKKRRESVEDSTITNRGKIEKDKRQYINENKAVRQGTTQGYQMSDIDRMIIRQEEILMRQSEKFLKHVKQIVDEDQ
ncbi:uncharacterized protein BBOV_IV004105 [Babesia bovis T2Bo]|uniref:uncharacterized protein n=1 Tax=Babesia bovis T2Bo TaxID=484906 RepID=UPI001D7DD987|nr:uncharacterized protein BBOV_IV004105 [Babesia bovis T2Bo]KAG6439951.1 hypothetical protein BBOV_IV004105 [Babesia bovis T2Bo]